MYPKNETLISDCFDQSVIYRRLNGSNGPLSLLIDSFILHDLLSVTKDVSTWINGIITEYGYLEGEDYYIENQSKIGNHSEQSIYLSMDMAKEVCLICKTEVGMSIRRLILSLILP